MPETNLAVKPYIVSGVEWTLDKKFHFGIEQAKYLQDNISLNHKLPVNGVTIPFSDNVWDFNECFHYRSGSEFRFSFGSIPEGFIVSAKYFVLMTLLNADNKIPTIFRRFQDLIAFFKAVDQNNVKCPNHITTKDIRLYMDTYIKNHSAKTSTMTKIALYNYTRYLVVNYDYKYKIDLQLFDEYDWLTAEMARARVANKTPNIPEEYYNKLTALLIQVMNDTNANYSHRAVACLYIMLSQTGLRITELHAFTKDSLKEISVANIDRAYFLEVREFKAASRQEEFVTFRTFANELTVKAFNTLLLLSADKMKERNSEFIYQPNSRIPAPSYVSLQHFKNLLFTYAPFTVVSKEDESPYAEMTVVKIDLGKNKYGYVVAPTTKQFRVHVCTELYYTHHVSLLFIQKCMGHLSDEMQGYYVRPKNKVPLELEESHRLLRDVLQKKITLLGGKGKEISEQIERFIVEANYNINDGTDALIKYLDGKVAIRVKKSGFCVKATAYRECSRDAKTNEIYCAYDICPNLCHVYYMASDSYEDFKLLQRTFKENVKNGFDLQASRELNKLKAVCRQRLIPELDDMKKKIQLRGLSTVLMDYPQLEPVIKNYDTIMEEIELWRAKSH